MKRVSRIRTYAKSHADDPARRSLLKQEDEMVEATPVEFKSSDGRKFETEEQAQSHEELIEAKERYEAARSAYGQILHESQKTADGYPFQFSVLADYWYVYDFSDFPRLDKVSFYLGNCDLNDEDETIITQHHDDHRGNRHFTDYSIGDLYRYEKNAQVALLAAQKERLQELSKSVKQLEHVVEARR